MDDESSKPERTYPLAAGGLSKTPSWIMLGFVLGAATVLSLPSLKRSVPPEPVTFKAVEPPPSGPREPPLLTTIEDVFATWGHLAVWSDNVTEVALWNVRDRSFNQFFEVRRTGELLYFRTIPRLTRRVISRGKPVDECPLQFTETEEQFAEWMKYGRTERPVEREPRVRPPPASPAPPPVPVERSIRVEAPPLPRPQITPQPGDKSG